MKTPHIQESVPNLAKMQAEITQKEVDDLLAEYEKNLALVCAAISKRISEILEQPTPNP